MRRTIAILALTTGAQAQMLDLGGPRAPEPGDGRAALRLARELLAESSELLGPGTPAARARASIRRTAARAITTGDALEPDGSAISLLGLTLGAHIDTLDALIASAPPHTAAAVSADLDALIAESPSDVRAWEQGLLFALSPLIGSDARPGWPDHDPTEMPELEPVRELLTEAGLDDGALAHIDELAASGDLLDDWPSFGPTVRHEARLIADAARAAGNDAPWLSGSVRQRLLSDMSLALRTPHATERLVRLRVLALDAVLIDRLTELPRDAVARDVRDRFVLGIATRADPPEQTLRTLPRSIEILERAAWLESLPHERTLPRALWPMYRVLVPEARSRAGGAKEAAVLLATDAAGATDPGVLSSLARFEELSGLLDGLISLADRLRDGNGRVPIELEGVASRLKAIGTDALDDRDRAFALLGHCLEQRELADDITGLLPLVATALPDAGDLVAHANGARALWTNAWSVPGGAGLSEQQLRRVLSTRRLLAAIADASASLESAQALGAWELPTGASDRLADGLDEALLRLIRRTLAGTSSPEDLALFESRYAVALLAGRLARLSPLPRRTLGEIVTGPPPPGARFEPLREDLASICRYAVEIEEPGAEGARPYINSIARRLRDRLPLFEPSPIEGSAQRSNESDRRP